jgi:MFS family permease
LPQLFTAGYVTRLARYKPTVIFMTIQERWPFFGLALVAGLAATLGKEAALVLAFVMLMWHALGAGLTGTAWQSMIGKLFPANLRGTFWGIQAAGISVLMGVGSVVAGLLIDKLPSPLDFTLCFLAAGAAVAVSMAFLALTREPAHTPAKIEGGERFALRTLVGIMRTDSNFGRFVMARMLTQLTMMAVAFYTIYAVRTFGIGAAVIGVLGASRPVVQMVANPILGWIGDRWGHRRIFALASLAGGLSAHCVRRP